MPNRRAFLTTAGIAVAAAAARAQTAASNGATPRDYASNAPVQYPDPDIIALDNRFRKYMIGNTTIRRH